MGWKIVRLELAHASGAPKSSPSRAYLLRVPLDRNDLIDCDSVQQSPSLAAARRFWSSEPDQFGHLERSDGHWELHFLGQQGGSIRKMPGAPLRLNRLVTIENPDGTADLFRVVSVKSNEPAAGSES
jgi:hypothetical protein